MIEHWYEYLPAAWHTPARWYVLASVLLLMAIAFVAGYLWGRNRKRQGRTGDERAGGLGLGKIERLKK